MAIDVTALNVGTSYDRPQLASLWGYESFHAISRGVVTPRGENKIVLFITENNQPALPQYDNRFTGDLLWIDGEEGHRSDERLATSRNRDKVFLFYRQSDHSPFQYCGEVFLVDAFRAPDSRPSRFVFTAAPQIMTEAESVLEAQASSSGESAEGKPEGQRRMRMHTVYERSPQNRRLALQYHGHRCSVCGFDFDTVYGADLACQYIEVHHLQSIADIDGRTVDPTTDLAPVCANCHRMAHRRADQIIPLSELRERIQRFRGA